MINDYRDGPVGPYASDGQEYMTVVNGAVKPEGAPMNYIPSEVDAWDAYWTLMDRMWRERPNTHVEYRVRPWLHTDPDKGHYVRARLAFVADGAYSSDAGPSAEKNGAQPVERKLL